MPMTPWGGRVRKEAMNNPKTGLSATLGQHQQYPPALPDEPPANSHVVSQHSLIHAASAHEPHNPGGRPTVTDQRFQPAAHRCERISELRILISQGTYAVPADQVAAQILANRERS